MGKVYQLYEGGNALQLPWSTQTSGRVGHYQVLYAAHHKRRTLEIERHLDTQSYDWRGFSGGLNGEADDKPIKLETNDAIATHIFGRGALIDYVIFHVKRPGSGTIAPFLELDNGTRKKVLDPNGEELSINLGYPGHYMGMVASNGSAPDDDKNADSDDEESDENSSNSGQMGNSTTKVKVKFPAQTGLKVNMKNVDGGVFTDDFNPEEEFEPTVDIPEQEVEVEVTEGGKPVPYLTPDNGTIGFTFTAAKDSNDKELPFDTCIGIYMAVKDFWDEHECACAPAPCETSYPDPTCFAYPEVPSSKA